MAFEIVIEELIKGYLTICYHLLYIIIQQI
jgi:hypothetical protein